MAYKVCIIRAPGTNCDRETAMCVESQGLEAEVVHVKRLMDGEIRFSDYDGLIIPGGFSFGDHVRAGALLGKILKERFGDELAQFSSDGKPILGICNGFQVLVECGLLPGNTAQSALTTNLSSRFECRWVDLSVETSRCIFTDGLSGSIRLPVAHGEGRFLVTAGELKELTNTGQVVFKYAQKNGGSAGGSYPENPNGSIDDIAGICNKEGNVFGLMPHPERAFYRFLHPRWTKSDESESFGDGYKIFNNMAEYIMR
ncbi:MAG TPA: phosphoribosylformylglycinamidine synthase I [Euryarchaeota archaeon]|nr:phosphoribosylformylglycinamidine synthase I [Euryarchaeota archaeon]